MPDTATSETRAAPRRKRFSINAVFDNIFFVLAGLAAVWLAYLIFSESFAWGWGAIWFAVVFWLLLAYLVLPRVHRILTQLYVPDYFIGRARTSDGLLGDPVNLAVIATGEQLHQTMDAAGWIRADDITLASTWRIVTSTLTHRSYDEAPVSPLFLFGRQQDFAYQQEVEGNPAKRHHVRFWKCPPGWMLPGGHRVDWLAAGTFDRAVGFSLFTLQITHKIDENTDIERDHIVTTMRGAHAGVRVVVIRDFATGYHARNGGGDTIRTDGDLPVVDLRRVRLPGQGVPGDVVGEPEQVVELRGIS
ncbi:LssY C-terminal domain-containing protein [Luethyella okanaganae]|uniref:LssY C-terminal domain-containing protein n=1 Tax=Luethyella okanaganae TaxID=69372 RepID=A0ABW1VG15_9MICO